MLFIMNQGIKVKQSEEKTIKLKVGVIIRQGEKIILIKERLNKNLSYGWNVCAGSWEEIDHDLKNAALREAKEEAGVDARIIGFYKAVLVNMSCAMKLQFFFIADAISEPKIPPKSEQEKLHEDIIECKAFAPNEILQMNDDEFVSTTMARILKDYAANPSILPLDSVAHFDSEVKF